VLKPGGYLLAFGGTRTYHRLVCGLEDAGFEIRDTICWLYGSGFPKNLDISKQIDKMAGAEREVIGSLQGGSAMNLRGQNPRPWHERQKERGGEYDITAPATEAAEEGQGWGTALKPAFEPIVVARKPLSEKNVASNVLKWGTGGLDIDGSRIDYQSDSDKDSATPQGKCTAKSGALAGGVQHNGERSNFERPDSKGRWPANVILDEEAGAMLDEQSGELKPGGNISGLEPSKPAKNVYGEYERHVWQSHNDSGGASRFFYCAKANPKERGKGNVHPTCKPIALMEYLVKLVSRQGAVVLDPFAGSMSTVLACVALGRKCIAVEQNEEYCEMLKNRVVQTILI